MWIRKWPSLFQLLWFDFCHVCLLCKYFVGQPPVCLFLNLAFIFARNGFGGGTEAELGGAALPYRVDADCHQVGVWGQTGGVSCFFFFFF